MQHLSLPCAFVLALSLVVHQPSGFAAPLAAEGSGRLRIGVLLPLTGEFGFFGDEARKGAELAKEELAGRGDIIELVYQDDKCLPKPAVSGFHELTVIQKVVGIVGPGCTGGILAIAPLANNAGLPVLALLDANEQIKKAGGIAVLGYSSEQEAYLIAEELKRRGIQRAAMICEADGWADVVCQAFRQRWQVLGGELTADELQQLENRDYRSVIQKALLRKPQALYFVPAFNGGLFLKQCAELGVDLPIFGPDTFGVKEAVDIAGKAAEGAVYANVNFTAETGRQKRFVDLFKRRYGSEPSSLYYAALGYDAVRIMARTLRERGPWSRALQALHYDDGVLPAVRFDSTLMAKIEPELMTIRDGAFVPLSK